MDAQSNSINDAVAKLLTPQEEQGDVAELEPTSLPEETEEAITEEPDDIDQEDTDVVLEEADEVGDSEAEDDQEEYEAGKALVQKAKEAFKSRFSKMIIESHTVGSKEPSFKEEYLTRMERELFRIGRESCEEFTRWKYQTSERMEACTVVLQARKRSQMKRKVEMGGGRNGSNGGVLRPRNF